MGLISEHIFVSWYDAKMPPEAFKVSSRYASYRCKMAGKNPSISTKLLNFKIKEKSEYYSVLNSGSLVLQGVQLVLIDQMNCHPSQILSLVVSCVITNKHGRRCFSHHISLLRSLLAVAEERD